MRASGRRGGRLRGRRCCGSAARPLGFPEPPTVDSLKRAIAAERRASRRAREQAPRGARGAAKVEVRAPDLWPVHGLPVAYCPAGHEADDLVGALVFDKDPLPSHVAIHCERRPNLEALREGYRDEGVVGQSARRNPAAIVSVCTGDHVIVLQPVHYGQAGTSQFLEKYPYIARLFSTTRVAKACFEAEDTARSLKRDYLWELQDATDIAVLSRGLAFEAGRNNVNFRPAAHTLRTLFRVATGQDLPRPARVLVSNWHGLPLLPEQIAFASNNAYAAWHCFQHLMHVQQACRESPDGPWHCVYVSVNEFVLPFPAAGPRQTDALDPTSPFARNLRTLLEDALSPYGVVRNVWLQPPERQLCVAAFEQAESVQKAVDGLVGHPGLIVDTEVVPWHLARPEFKHRVRGLARARGGLADEDAAAAGAA
eukprot:TRINITY_DN60752_c0_g1_i1.p1 TRINITY_DN60752_c0_g1~~TRINITY_DN60752_c0_g1_i1.p1  ORF type:complete len:425 (+),score=91.26 TRINITY_DN60752_c0_g1_i1:62-1336(+)